VQEIEVEDIEPADDRAVEQERPRAFERAEGADETEHLAGPVGPIDPHPADAGRLETLGEAHDDRGDRGVDVPPAERPVVDRDDRRMGLGERAPQR